MSTIADTDHVSCWVLLSNIARCDDVKNWTQNERQDLWPQL